MATNDDRFFRPTNEASVALLRGLRANTVNRSFIHRADVCSAVPEELIADLQPVPGTEETEEGYNSVWYIYCPKRYKNARGEPTGHRQREVEVELAGGKTCWHSEIGPKPVQGVPGATLCSLSYGRKEKVSGRRDKFIRMGWTMTEFDDTQGGGGDHVLCRVHRSSSSLAKKQKSKYSSSSSSSSKTKTKAAGDHPEAPSTKLIHDEQVQVQQNPAAFFADAYPTMPCYGYGPPQGVYPVTMVGGDSGEEECGVQQPRVELEAEHFDGGEFNFNVEPLLNMEEFTNAYSNMPYDLGVPQVVDPVTMVGGEEERGVQQPRVEPEYSGEFNFSELLNFDEQQVQMPVQQDPAAFTNAYYPTMPACYGHDGTQGVDPVTMFGDVEPPEHGGDLGEFNFQDLLKTDGWKGFEDFLAGRDQQGLQQPTAEPAEQGGGIVVSQDLLYAC